MADSQTNLSWDVLLDLGSAGGGPLHERLKHALRKAISQGVLQEGTNLPPSRQLALDLRCSRSTVTEAYAQLAAEGYLEGRPGSGTRVRWARDRSAAARVSDHTVGQAPRFDMAPGLPDLRAFPRTQWVKAVAAQAASMTYRELGYPAAGGHARLRALLADYLNRARGANVTPDSVIVCSSVTDAVRRISIELMSRGIHELGFEEPGWARLREVARAAGLAPVPVPVDRDGLRVDALREHASLRAVVVTPAHQYPGGSVLAPRRRAALLEWARDTDGVIIEDDYDAEFRYDRHPVGTLQGMDESRVPLLKSLSKVLSPALTIGWIAAPWDWVEPLRGDRTASSPPPTLDQLAFASFLTSGSYDRHLRSSRQRYRSRRDVLVKLLADKLPELSVSGVAAGLHLVLTLPAGVDPVELVTRAVQESVRITNLAGSFHEPHRSTPGLVLGYGNLPDASVHEAVTRLAAAYSRV